MTPSHVTSTPLLTLRISLQMYAVHSSFSEFPFVFLIKSVTEPAPQNSITSYRHKQKTISHMTDENTVRFTTKQELN